MKLFGKRWVKFISLLTVAMLFASFSFVIPANAEEEVIGEGLIEIGIGLQENMDEDAFAFRAPERRMLRAMQVPSSVRAFDLRDRNVVTPVKLQNPFGTCWGFAAIASAETNILSHGLTTETANSFDLSEKHLAFFARRPIDRVNPKTVSQEGEGTIFKGQYPSSQIYNEGFSFVATSLFAAGIGPAKESDNPLFAYRGKNGYTYNDPAGNRLWYSEDDDWWIDDNLRWKQDYVLKESFILPLPSAALEKGNTTDWERANKAIKEQIYDGNAVQVGFYADTSQPGQEAETEYLSPEWAHYTFEKKNGNHAVTIVGWDDNYPKENFHHLKKDGTQAPIPNNNGAWLVKNSWGAETNDFPNNGGIDWGLLEGQDKGVYNETTGRWEYNAIENAKHTGYFWLSYEDRSIDSLEALEFDRAATQPYYLAQYDLMPVNHVDFTANSFKVSMANVFNVNDILDEGKTAAKLEEVSCQTASPDTTVTYDIYLLGSGAQNPADGTQIAHFVKTYKYGGFHKESLPEPAIVRSGEKFAVVVTQLAPDGKYGFNVQFGLNQRGTSAAKKFYSNGVINNGESYLYNASDNIWNDLGNESVRRALLGDEYDIIAMDNFPIKAYLSKTDDPDVDITAPTAINDLTYDRNSHALVNPGAVKRGTTVGTMYYAVDNGSGYPGEYSTSVPEKTNAGSYRVYYKAVINGNIVRWGDVEAVIAPKQVTVDWSGTDSVKYDGQDHGVSATISGMIDPDVVTPVTEGTSQKNAGNYTARVTGLAGADKGNYALPGTGLTRTFSITPRNVTIISASDSKDYDGQPLTNTSVDMESKGDKFVSGEGADITVTGSRIGPGTSRNTFTYVLNSNTREGNYNITCEEGTLTVNWWGDDKKDEHPVTITAKSATVDYDGTEQRISGFEDGALLVDLGDVTCEITGVSAEGSGTVPGTYSNRISGTPVIRDPGGVDVTSHFVVDTQNGTLTIRPGSVDNATITLQNELLYNGSEQTQNISVSVNGRTLERDTDYEVTGDRATSAGTHTLTVTGKRYYKGSVSKDYEIKQQEITGVSVSQKGTLTYNGNAQVPVVKMEYDQDGVTFTFAKSSDATFTSGVPSYREAGEYTVYYRAEKQYCVPKSGSFTVTIDKATLGISWGNTTFSYDGNSHVPTAKATGVCGDDNIRFTVSGETSQAGTHTATVTGIEGSGAGNYKLPSNKSVSFEIKKSSSSSSSGSSTSAGSSNSTNTSNSSNSNSSTTSKTTTNSNTTKSTASSGNTTKSTASNSTTKSTASNSTTKSTASNSNSKNTSSGSKSTATDTNSSDKDSKTASNSDKNNSKSDSGSGSKIAKNTTLSDNEEALKSILGDEKFKELSDEGKTPSVRLGVTELKKSDVPEKDRKLAEEKIEECKASIPNLTVGAYLDLILEIKEDSDWKSVSDTKKPVKISVKIPSDISKKAEKCFMMCIHGDKATLLEDTDEDPETLTVESDGFSTYLLLYQEKESTKEKEEAVAKTTSADSGANNTDTSKIEEKSPDTGTAAVTEKTPDTGETDSDMWRIVVFVIIVVVVVGLILLGVYGSKIMSKK